MVTCYIGLGSNLGDRGYYISSALKMIKLIPFTRVSKVSSFIETKPLGGAAQGDYLNAVGEIETGLSPYALLMELQKIEFSLGRLRSVKNAPRTIDLDILLFGDFSISEEALVIPHPRIKEREFVLVPLQEIAPEVAVKFISSRLKRRKKTQ